MFFIKKKNQESITNKNLLKNNKFILAITPILLGIACLIISGMVGSSMEPDGTFGRACFLLNSNKLFIILYWDNWSIICINWF